ncbi:hypothetical protein H0O02_01480, partial [Candidatus Micrarchaeota archaeon]|nr:hypothetical protein [Candidatus Micrarchaeota archaeon]
MFVSFDPFTLLAIIFVCFFVPGALLAFSIFRKDDFLFIEKAFIGFGIAIVAIPAVPFLLYFFLGVKYTYDIALATVGLFYLVSIAAFAITKTYEDVLGFFKGNWITDMMSGWRKLVLPLGLLTLLFISFWLRFGSYGPIYQELDPYFYTYIPQQLLVLGENPLDDKTAWYPEVQVSHRQVPELSYLEAIWYSLYNGSNGYDNMLLAGIASIYPPLAAMLAVFFLYLLISSVYKREYGLIGAGIASFAPMMIYKLMAGEQEVQPYAFFALAFFFSMYALMLLRKEMKFAVLAGIAFFAVCLGSSSEVLAIGTLIIFSLVYAFVLFIREKDSAELKEMLKLNAVVFCIGMLFGSAILKSLFYSGYVGGPSLIPGVIILAFFGFLVILKEQIAQQNAGWIAVAMVLVGVIFILSPLGAPLKNIGAAGFGVAEFSSPLYRTIAEQGATGGFIHSSVGFVASPYKDLGNDIVEPFASLIAALLTPLIGSNAATTFASPLNTLGQLAGDAMDILFLPITLFVNFLFSVSVSIFNGLLGTNVDYGAGAGNFIDYCKAINGFVFLWIFVLLLAFIYSIYRSGGKGISIPLFFAALILPAFLVGIIKAKYTIYSAFLIGAGIAFVLGEMDNFVMNFKGAGKDGKTLKLDLSEEKRKKYAQYVMIFGLAMLFFQFVGDSFAPALFIGTFTPKFQDDPLAAQAKFKEFCSQSGDATVCAAAADPMGYAGIGTNYQYDE